MRQVVMTMPRRGVRLFLVIITMLVGMSIQTSARDAERFELEAQQMKKLYEDCLSNEKAKVAPRKLTRQDIVTFIKGACLNEQSQFRNALIKLFSRNRDMDQQMIYATVDRIVAASIDDFVRSKVRR